MTTLTLPSPASGRGFSWACQVKRKSLDCRDWALTPVRVMELVPSRRMRVVLPLP